MHIQCPTCSARILAEDIDLPQRMAKCRKCHAIFTIAGMLAAEGIGVDRPRPTPKPIPPEPPAYAVVEEWGTDLSVWWRWADPSVIFMIFFCLFWDSFLVAIYGSAMVSWVNGQPVAWEGLIFPLGHLAAGIAITYATLCHLLNLTWVQFNFQTLTVRHGPVPIWGNQAVDTREIEQLFIAHGTGWRRSGTEPYTLSAVMKDGTRLELATATDLDFLFWLERKLEEKLKIEDRPVPGEVEW